MVGAWGGMWRSGNSPVTNTGMDPAGDENVGSSPGLGNWHVAPFLRANRREFSPGTPVSSPSSK